MTTAPIGHRDRPIATVTTLAARFGAARQVPSVAQLAHESRIPDFPQPGRTTTPVPVKGPSADVISVGDQPAGFGVEVVWHGENDLAVVAYVNTSSPEGVAISGVRDGDAFELLAARGSASFAVDHVNEGIPGLIGVIGEGLKLTATVFESPELIPFLQAATTYAQSRFPEHDEPAKIRDPFGEDQNGAHARAEGGALVSCPSARSPYTSGTDSDAGRQRWIQHDGRRVPANFPTHIAPGSAFFLRRDTGVERLQGTGTAFLTAWDHLGAFKDNFGHYEVRFILRRADSPGDGPRNPVVQ